MAILIHHRNFIFDAKYGEKDPGKYQKFGPDGQAPGDGGQHHSLHLGDLEDRLNQGVRHIMGDIGDNRPHRGRHEGPSRGHNEDPGRVNIQLCRR